jgi:hypothetical protein
MDWTDGRMGTHSPQCKLRLRTCCFGFFTNLHAMICEGPRSANRCIAIIYIKGVVALFVSLSICLPIRLLLLNLFIASRCLSLFTLLSVCLSTFSYDLKVMLHFPRFTCFCLLLGIYLHVCNLLVFFLMQSKIWFSKQLEYCNNIVE